MKSPTRATLRKYGLSLVKWQAMWEYQGGACAICKRSGKPLQIDHHHAKGWQSMKPERRVQYVRQLVCWPCNRFLLGPVRYGMTPERYRRAADYLEKWGYLNE